MIDAIRDYVTRRSSAREKGVRAVSHSVRQRQFVINDRLGGLLIDLGDDDPFSSRAETDIAAKLADISRTPLLAKLIKRGEFTFARDMERLTANRSELLRFLYSEGELSEQGRGLLKVHADNYARVQIQLAALTTKLQRRSDTTWKAFLSLGAVGLLVTPLGALFGKEIQAYAYRVLRRGQVLEKALVEIDSDFFAKNRIGHRFVESEERYVPRALEFRDPIIHDVYLPVASEAELVARFLDSGTRTLFLIGTYGGGMEYMGGYLLKAIYTRAGAGTPSLRIPIKIDSTNSQSFLKEGPEVFLAKRQTGFLMLSPAELVDLDQYLLFLDLNQDVPEAERVLEAALAFAESHAARLIVATEESNLDLWYDTLPASLIARTCRYPDKAIPGMLRDRLQRILGLSASADVLYMAAELSKAIAEDEAATTLIRSSWHSATSYVAALVESTTKAPGSLGLAELLIAARNNRATVLNRACRFFEVEYARACSHWVASSGGTVSASGVLDTLRSVIRAVATGEVAGKPMTIDSVKMHIDDLRRASDQAIPERVWSVLTAKMVAFPLFTRSGDELHLASRELATPLLEQ